jgi:class 3 adenylate cyclase
MPTCRDCGEVNPEIARYCLACGTPLREHLDASGEMRKTATIVFADIVESTALGERLDAESVRTIMGRYFQDARTVLERHGGTVEKFIGDAVFAVFGVPVQHEDDALRAVRAAVELRDRLKRLSAELEDRFGVRLQLRIGVDTGEVVAGDTTSVGSFATGEPVNVAFRLQASALPDEILIGESTRRLVRDVVPLDPRGPLAVKGKARPVSSFSVVDAPDHALRPRVARSPFVGRTSELQLLSKAFEQCGRRRTCHLTTVVGSPGVGKSRLVDEFLASCQADAVVVQGRCLPYGDGITFWPLREIVVHAAELSGDESPADAFSKIRSLLGPSEDADLAAERIAEIIGVTAPAERPDVPFWAVQRLFESLGRNAPLVAVFDDVQWAEPVLLDLIEYVASRVDDVPAFLVCIGRPELFDDRLSWGHTEKATTMVLEPLPDEESELLVEKLLGRENVAVEARARILRTAEGNPLFVEEMIALLLDEGVSSMAVPPTIRALLGDRLDRLDAHERAVLQRGSVEGKVFHRGAVVEQSPQSERSLVDGWLTTLVLKRFLQPEHTSFAGEDAFQFHHQLLRDVAYASLPKAQRAVLHERFASWLERKAGERAQEYDEILGYHLEQAHGYGLDLGARQGDSALAKRAAERLGEAGLRARARGDMPATANLLTRAVALLERDDVTRAALVPKLHEAQLEAGIVRRSRWGWGRLLTPALTGSLHERFEHQVQRLA